MLAWRVHEFGPYARALRWEETPEPRREPDQVLVQIDAAGMNFADLLAIAGKYQTRAALPFTPGFEGVGRVLEAPAGAHVRPGDRVIAHDSWGAFAERMVCPVATTFALPDSLSDAEAAALHIAYQTAWFAWVLRARLVPGETVLVHGAAGGVGIAALQTARALGAQVIATAGGSDKAAVCLAHGAHHAIDHERDDFVARVKEITGGRGADVVFDSVGGDVFHASTKCVAFSGRIVIVGFASGTIPDVALNRVLLKNISVVGLNWGGYRQNDPTLFQECHMQLCRLHAQGLIRPLVHKVYARTELASALSDIEQRRTHGKAVLSLR